MCFVGLLMEKIILSEYISEQSIDLEYEEKEMEFDGEQLKEVLPSSEMPDCRDEFTTDKVININYMM